MIPARYSLIRYIPDPVRGEQLNVGILAWTDRNLIVQLDDDALQRVRRENPHLAIDALTGLAEQIEDELASFGAAPAKAAAAWLSAGRDYPTVATEDRHTMVAGDDADALREAVEQLLSRVVHPRRRTGGRHDDIKPRLRRALAPLLQSQRVASDYTFVRSRSGVPRQVDYFANSGANVALDLVKLAVSREKDIVRRADAEAFKIEDILERNEIDVVVLCTLGEDDSLRDATANAQRVIESVGAHVVTSVEQAATALRDAV